MNEKSQQARLEFEGIAQAEAKDPEPKTTVAPDYNKLFIKRLLELDRSKTPYEKFRDFCEMAYCAYAKLTAPSKEAADKLEERYMRIVGTYRDKDTIRAYPELLGYCAQSIANGKECLGAVASEMELLDSHTSQFFTPYEVSKMMAMMTFTAPDETIENEGFFSIQEPASGSGGMILAVADVIEQRGYNPSEVMLTEAIDISPLCFHMTYIQLTQRGLPALVHQGNTLAWEMYESAYTPPTLDFVAKHGRLFDKRPNPDADPKTEDVSPSPAPQPVFSVGEHGQLGLF